MKGPLAAWNSVDVSSCGARVREVERQRRLRVGASVAADSRGGAADRALPVGADREPHASRAAIERDGNARRIAGHRRRRGGDVRQLQLLAPCIEGGAEMTVLDIVAESVETDLRGGENDLGRANEPSGVIDNADRLERRGVSRRTPARRPTW